MQMVNMTGKTKGRPFNSAVNSLISPDIFSWPAVISNLANEL